MTEVFKPQDLQFGLRLAFVSGDPKKPFASIPVSDDFV